MRITGRARRTRNAPLRRHFIPKSPSIAARPTSKNSAIAASMAGSSVTDDSLVQCVSEIRRSLGDRDHRIVRTVSKKGYKVIAAPVPAAAASAGLPLPDQPSIAVLAFDDFSAGEDDDYLSDAIAEGIIAELSRFPELFVIARNSSFSFRGTPTHVSEISKRLGVRYLLEGSQQKNGHRLRVTTQLIDAPEGHHLWSETYERELKDLFDVPDDIVRRVVATVAQKVIKFEGRSAPSSLGTRRTALLHHLEARQYLVKSTPEDNKRAEQANLSAIRADPAQPYGYVGLAFVHINGHRWGWTYLDRDQALERARKAAQKAVELAPDYYDSHAAMAYVHLQDNDLERAIARAERAQELNPNDTNVMCDLAEFLGYAGRPDEAEQLLRKAMRLDPLHPDWIRWNMAWIQWLKGNRRDALRTMNAMSDVPPLANRVLAIIHMCLGQREKARDAIKRLLDYDPGYSIADVQRNYDGKFRNTADLDRMLANLRDAGLPD
jgi:TolB-like protein